MKILLFADFRSPHARSWAAGLRAAGVEVLCVSSEAIEDDYDAVRPADLLSKARQILVRMRRGNKSLTRHVTVSNSQPPESMQAAMALLRLPGRRRLLKSLCRTWSPDLVHALRLPYEALTALSPKMPVPVIASTWGQDFVPQAGNSRILKRWIARALGRAAGLQFDARIDLERAYAYGLPRDVPTLFAAGNFGLDPEMFRDSGTRISGHVVFPRGRAESANGRGFIDAVNQLKFHEGLTFTGVGLEGQAYAEEAASEPALAGRLELTPHLPRQDFARLLQTAHVVVSPAFTDGTPNSILEAVACGAHVVAGRIPAIEALEDELNVLTLVDPSSPVEIAEAILKGLDAEPATVLLPDHYSAAENLHRVPEFYQQVLGRKAV